MFFFSGMFSLPSAKSASVPRAAARSYWFISVQTLMPPLTTYLPWSPASYQPPLTSSLYVQPEPGRHGTSLSP